MTSSTILVFDNYSTFPLNNLTSVVRVPKLYRNLKKKRAFEPLLSVCVCRVHAHVCVFVCVCEVYAYILDNTYTSFEWQLTLYANSTLQPLGTNICV